MNALFHIVLAMQGPVEFANVALFEELSIRAETQNVNAVTSAGYVYGQVCRLVCAHALYFSRMLAVTQAASRALPRQGPWLTLLYSHTLVGRSRARDTPQHPCAWSASTGHRSCICGT